MLNSQLHNLLRVFGLPLVFKVSIAVFVWDRDMLFSPGKEIYPVCCVLLIRICMICEPMYRGVTWPVIPTVRISDNVEFLVNCHKHRGCQPNE